MDTKVYYAYSDYLKKKYGEKVYKLPVKLPLTCPNRTDGSRGCDFCAAQGTGFEGEQDSVPVKEQLLSARSVIEKKYHAHKFIAYFQNYTNTFLPVEDFARYVAEAADVPDIVEIAVSTRPDCVGREYLDVLKKIREEKKMEITIELGLQTVNYRTLAFVNRGHTLAEYIDAVMQIKAYGFEICTHMILNLPGDTMEDAVESAKILSALGTDTVKLHSLYIARNTRLCDAYENGTISLCTKDEYQERVIRFLEYLSPAIAVERLFSRIPEKDSVFCNWGSSWRKLKDETIQKMLERETCQGRRFHYLSGAALCRLQEEDKIGKE